MRFVVTGANGYIGAHLVKTLLDDGHEVLAADMAFDHVDARAARLRADIFQASDTVFQELGSPDVCIHMAWRNGFVHNADSQIDDLPKHFHFIKAMLEGGLKHLVIMGSMHEVGYWEGAITEDTPTNPMSLYAVAKNALRQMTAEMAKKHQICFQWIRGYYILGDDERSSSIFAKILKADAEGKKTFPFTSGKNLYDFIPIDVLTRQIAAVAEQEKVTGIINCCSGRPVSLAEKVEGFIRDHALSIRLEYGAYPDRGYDSPGVWGDTAKIDQIMRERIDGHGKDYSGDL